MQFFLDKFPCLKPVVRQGGRCLLVSLLSIMLVDPKLGNGSSLLLQAQKVIYMYVWGIFWSPSFVSMISIAAFISDW